MLKMMNAFVTIIRIRHFNDIQQVTHSAIFFDLYSLENLYIVRVTELFLEEDRQFYKKNCFKKSSSNFL